jgi:hypothetical protein
VEKVAGYPRPAVAVWWRGDALPLCGNAKQLRAGRRRPPVPAPQVRDPPGRDRPM